MTITSTNHNPGNDSKYARRRSVFKGQVNQLRRTVASFQGSGLTVHEYWDTPFLIDAKFCSDWGVNLSVARQGAKGWHVLGSWDIKPPSQRILRAVGGLSSDLKTLWNDFMLVTAQRIGRSNGAGADTTDLDRYNGKSLLVFAYGPSSFDIVVSKYGYGEDLKRNHHFYQWQARSNSFQGLVNVDDYQGEEGLTFYVVS